MTKEEFLNIYEVGMESYLFETHAADLLESYIEDELTIEEGYRRLLDEDEKADWINEGFEWMFTPKGEKMFDKAVTNAIEAWEEIYNLDPLDCQIINYISIL